MLEERNIHEDLLQEGIPEPMLHALMHKILLLEIEYQKKQRAHRLYSAFMWTNRFKQLYYIKTLRDKALFLLKSQFAKKPKNPV